MHPEAYHFLESTLTPDIVDGARICEIGSYDVNGSPRALCGSAAEYVGVDRRKGKGVDVVNTDDSFDGESAFDIVICAETLEHARDPAAVIAVAHRSLKAGGLLVVTAAGPDRVPHSCDGEPTIPVDESYTAITRELLTELLDGWDEITIRYGKSHQRPHGDIYATARKAAPARKSRKKEQE